MSPHLEELLHSIAQLSSREKLELIGYITEQLKNQTEPAPQPRRSWRELRGAAPNILGGQDAQAWVNQLRDEWSNREVGLDSHEA